MASPIIVGLALRDDDAAPLALARQLSQLSGAPLVLAMVVPREAPARFPTPEYAQAIHEDASGKLEAVAAQFSGATTVVCDGSRSGALHELAAQQGAAAIVVGSTHRGRLGRLLIGDVGAGLLHGSTCPIAIAPRGYAPENGAFQRIGIAFDGTPESRSALEAALGIARRTDGFVRSFTVLEPLSWSPSLIRPSVMTTDEYDEVRTESAQRTADQALEARTDGARGASEVMHGPVVPALAGASSELDLLVCGSRGYGAMHLVMAGSVACGLAHDAACPLLVVPREIAQGADALWTHADALGVS
jgi:nucleotide-binding universal stress UspA family protein